MRILLQNSTFYPRTADDAGDAVFLLARALSEEGHHVDVLATTGRRQGPSRSLTSRKVDGVSGSIFEAPAHGLVDPVDGATARSSLARRTMHRLHRWASSRSPRWSALTRQVLTSERSDLLHTHTLSGMTASVWDAAAHQHIPVVHSLLDRHLLEVRSPRATRHVDLVIAPSRTVLDQHLGRGLFPHARQEILPPPAHPSVQPMPVRDTPRVPRALHLGPLDRAHGVELLLDLLGQWFEDPHTPPLNFSFAGTGPLEDRVRRFCSSWSKRASFHGAAEGVVKDRLLRESDVMVVASIDAASVETAVFDAFRYALPVLATAGSAMGEWIESERTGTLVEPDLGALRVALLAYVHDPARRHAHGRAAHEVALRHGLRTHLDQLLAWYAEFTAERVG